MRFGSGIRRLLGILLALAVLIGSGSPVLAQTPEASPTGAGSGPGLGDAVLLFDSAGDAVAQIAVSRGVELVIENLADTDFAFDVYGVQLIDETGYLSTSGFAFREEDATERQPELVGDPIPAGETVSGWLFFQVVNDAVPTLIVYYSFLAEAQFSVLANLGGPIAEAGEPSTIFSTDGSRIGSVTIDDIVTNVEETDPEIRASRGTAIVAVELTIVNDTEREIDPSVYSIYLVDEFGFAYSSTVIRRGQASQADDPDFPGDLIPAGGRSSGAIFFAVPGDATASYLIYTPSFENLFVLAQPGEGSVVSGDTIAPVEPTDVTPDGPDEIAEETSECVGVAAWVDDLNQRLTTMFESFEFLGDNLADANPDDVRTAAESIDEVLQDQSDAEVPAIAQDANDAMVAFLESYRDAFNEVADRLEAGDDPDDIENDFGDPEGEVMVSFDTTTTALEALQEACPDSGVEQIGF